MLKSNLCDYLNEYILLKVNITVTNTVAADAGANNTNKKVIFTNCATSANCISEINNTKLHNAKGIGIVMPVYNLVEYSDNYLKTLRNLWQYCKDIPVVNNDVNTVEFNGDNATDSFILKAKITGQADNSGRIDNFETMVPLKYFSNFWRTFEMTLINCEINLILTSYLVCKLCYNLY